jgi:soluble lytic murein transglycosylase
MPVVPRFDSQVSPGGAVQSRVDAPAFADVAGRQAQEVGQSLQQASAVAGGFALDIAQQANQVRVDDALNRAKEASLQLTFDKERGFTNLKGIAALERPGGKPLADEVGGTFKQQLDEIAKGLGNEAQRQLFSRHAGGMLASLRGNVTQHEASEFKNYSLSVAEGVQATAINDISMNWRNPDAVNAAVQRIEAETYRQANLLGKSAEWQIAHARKMTSNAHKTALAAALEANDPAYADAYLAKNADKMEASDILQVRGHITREMDARIGVTAAKDAFISVQPRMQNTDYDRAWRILIGTESNGKQFGKDGKPLESTIVRNGVRVPGAIGIAQVMEGTGPEAAKLAGLPWDRNKWLNDPAYNEAIGRAYFEKQLQTTGGDLAQAYAAYNAGPGALRNALSVAQRAAKGGDGSPEWLKNLPTETQNYVAKNMREFNEGGGRSAQPTQQDLEDRLASDPRVANNPGRMKVAREEARRMFEGQIKAEKQKEEEATADAMRGMLNNGGRWSDLPASVRNRVPPAQVDNMMQYGKRIATGENTTSLLLYSQLAANPTALAKMSEAQFFALRRELSEEDHKHFANVRAKLLNPQAVTGAGDLNSQAIKSALDLRLRALEIDPTPKEKQKAEAMRVGAVRQFVDRYFATAQREAGKKFTDAEVMAHVDGLFAKNVEFRNTFMGFDTGSSSKALLSMKASDIDSASLTAIKAAWKKRGVSDPTDGQVLDLYLTAKATTGTK